MQGLQKDMERLANEIESFSHRKRWLFYCSKKCSHVGTINSLNVCNVSQVLEILNVRNCAQTPH